VSSVQSKGQICILDIDVQGVQNVKKSSLNPYYVFIAPPSMDTLEARLRGRGTDNEESIQKRLENARGEMEYGQEEGNFDMYLVNCDLKQAADELCATVKTWYPFLQEQQQQQQQQEQDNEVKSDKESKGEKVDVTNSCSGLEADLPDDEAKDEISEAKTEVMDNTTDDAMLEDLDSCLDDDDGDACEAVEQPVDRSEEDHPEDEVETDRFTASTIPKDNVLAVQIDEVRSGDELNGNVTENKDADIDEENSTPKPNVDAVQNVVIPTDNATKQSDEVQVNVAENKEIVYEEDSIPNSNTGSTQNVVIPTDNATDQIDEVQGDQLNGNVTEIKGKVVEEDSVPNPNADSAQNVDVVVPSNNDTKQIGEIHGDDLNSPFTESKEMVVEGESTTPTTNTDVTQTVSNNNKTAIFYTLQELKVPIDGVDWACREDYLSDDDIVKYFEMTREELKALPKWKRQAAKKKLGIF
jgi:Guanylate kinase